MTTDHEIARWRFRTQRLVRPHAATAEDVARHLLAVQAENPRQSEWAVAARTEAPDPDEIDALRRGDLIRTHVLRPTWHYVHADDLGWLLDLTAPRVLKLIDQQLHTTHGLDDAQLTAATTSVTDLLAAHPDRTRPEIAEALDAAGVPTGGQLVMLLLAHLELRQRICSGSPRAGEHTYALFDDRVPAPRRLDRDAALAELAVRYFTGHGPATERDLAYWATLPLGDVRTGLAAAAGRLESFEHDGRTFWHAAEVPPTAAGEPAGHLLQVLDETYRGYQDSRWVLDADGLVPRGREASIGMAVVDAQLVAGMRRTVTASSVVFALTPYRPLRDGELDALEQAAGRYGDYLGLPATLEIQGGDR